MPIFVLVRKLVLLVCIKSALIMSFPARTINKIPLLVIFVLVRKLVLLVCIKSALIMSFPARTINKIPLLVMFSN